MNRILWTILVGVYLAQPALTQERKIEISPFAGGYLSTGFQTYEDIQLGPTIELIESTPVNEPNSGIFGLRASYELSPRIAVEGTFGFSPAGRQGFGLQPFFFSSLDDFLAASPTSSVPTLVVRGKDTFHGAGSILFPLRKVHDWTPFLAAGAGAVTRTGEVRLQPATTPGSILLYPTYFSFSIPKPTETAISLNLGGGVKTYFTDRYGMRFDFRSYISKAGADMVNNMEVSLGLIFRL